MAVGDRESAARHIAWVAAHSSASDAPPSYAVFARALDLIHGGGADDDWDAVVATAGAAAMRPVEHLEILCLRASCEQGRGQNEAARATFAAARTFIDRFPAWKSRFDGLGPGTAAWGNMQQPRFHPTRKASISSP